MPRKVKSAVNEPWDFIIKISVVAGIVVSIFVISDYISDIKSDTQEAKNLITQLEDSKSNNDLSESAGGDGTDELAGVVSDSSCGGGYCVTTTDGKKYWEGLDGFDITDGQLMKPILSSLFSGRMMYLRNELHKAFQVEYLFTPVGKRASNSVVEIKRTFRCVVGDGDYRTLTCQYNKSFPSVPEDWVTLSEINGDGSSVQFGKGLLYKSPVKVLLDVTPNFQSLGFKVVVSVTGYERETEEEKKWVHEYDVPVSINLEETPINVGFGLIDPGFKHGDIAAYFGRLRLLPKLGDARTSNDLVLKR